MMFVLKYWKFLTAGLVVLMLMGGLYWYGQNMHRKGYNAATALCFQQRIEQEREARNDAQDIEEQVRKTPDSAIVTNMRDAGWLRNDNDY